MEETHAFTGAEGNKQVEIHARDDQPFVALTFKTLAEPHVGDVSYFRVLSGKVSNGQDVYNATRDGTEKLGHVALPLGRERVEVSQLHAGDIGCVAKLRNTHTNDTLSTREHPVRMPAIAFPEPLVHFAVRAMVRGDEDKLQIGLHRLHDEEGEKKRQTDQHRRRARVVTDICLTTRLLVVSFLPSLFPPSIAVYRKRRRVACSRDSHSSILSRRCTMVQHTRSTPTKCHSRWRAFLHFVRWRQIASR